MNDLSFAQAHERSQSSTALTYVGVECKAVEISLDNETVFRLTHSVDRDDAVSRLASEINCRRWAFDEDGNAGS
jgi:hypothetical protein